MKRSVVSAAVAALALGGLLAACATPPPPPAGPTGPITYRLVSLMGRAPTFDGATLRIDGPRANGATGCNTFNAMHDPAATQPFRWFQLTRMACSDLQMAMERQYLDALDAARTMETSGGQLILKDASGTEVARFTSQPAQAPAPGS